MTRANFPSGALIGEASAQSALKLRDKHLLTIFVQPHLISCSAFFSDRLVPGKIEYELALDAFSFFLLVNFSFKFGIRLSRYSRGKLFRNLGLLGNLVTRLGRLCLYCTVIY